MTITPETLDVLEQRVNEGDVMIQVHRDNLTDLITAARQLERVRKLPVREFYHDGESVVSVGFPLMQDEPNQLKTLGEAVDNFETGGL